MRKDQEEKYIEYIRLWKAGDVDGMRGKTAISRHIRRYLFEKHDSKCTRCGWCSVHPVTGLVPLEVEHMDGNHQNNREENLDLVCPNCHSLTTTYRSLNNGSGRKRKTV